MLLEDVLDTEGLISRLSLLRRLSQSITAEIGEIEKKRQATKNASLQKTTVINLEEQVTKFEIDLIRFALLKTGGRQNSAAQFLQIKRSTLSAKIKRYQISVESYRLLEKTVKTDA